MLTKEETAGDFRYFKDTQKCECCKRVKETYKFAYAYRDTDGLLRKRPSPICLDCREGHKQASGSVKWNKPGNSAEEVNRPAIIDLMESYRERN